MMRLSRDDICALAGATRDELDAFERLGLLVPRIDRWPLWAKHEPYYTENHVEVLRWLAKTRRLSAAARRVR
jgi:DNA-binding transcriptional MerR regulator